MASVQASNSASDIFAALNAQATAASSAGGSTSAAVQDRFLQLLITQLKNQDPLNPLDNAAVTTQISQINTVAGIERLNATLETLLGAYGESQAMQAAALIGKDVLVGGSGLVLAGGEARGGVSLGAPVDRVVLTVLDGAGRPVQKQVLGAHGAGSFSFVWDGRTDTGAVAPPGNYRFTVVAERAGEKVEATALQLGTVSALIRDKSGSFQLDLGGLGRVNFDQVQQVF